MTYFKQQLLSILTSLAFVLTISPVYADMSLDNTQSTVKFVSIKKGSAAEVHSINKLSGSLSDEGELKLALDLSSVDTKIDIRNDRMKKYLFEIEKFATATITAKLDNLPVVDGISQISADAILGLHGVSKTIKVDVTLMKSGDQLMVANNSPVIINTADYGMDSGVAMLQKLAKLPSIATAVPVNFVLVFSKQDKKN